MDHSKLYQYRFDELLKIVKRDRKFYDFQERENDQIIDICGNGFREYQRIISHNESWVIDTIEKIMQGLFDIEGIKYDIPRYEEKKSRGGMNKVRPFAFTVKEKKGIIAYVFLYRQSKGLIEIRNNCKKFKGIDGVRFYFLQRDYREQIDMLNDIERKDDESFLEFYSIQDFFEQKFGKEEFSVFMEYVNKFNERARNLIGFKTVEMPTDDVIRTFKKKKEDMLKDKNYTLTLLNEIEATQKSIIIDNFINNKRYMILTGNSDFADSFVSSEWYYRNHTVTGAIDQTGLVTGYLKSIEQLLYALIRLAINKNRRIGINLNKKDQFSGKIYPERDIDFTEDNEVYADTTLGSLIHFVRKKNEAGDFSNADLFEVHPATIQIIIDKLYRFKNGERNDHLHKCNLYSSQEIDNIREKAMQLYCLLLGSFKISSGDYAKLIAYDTHEVLLETINEEELIEIIMEWATPIMMFDMPKKSHTVAFKITKFDGMDWNLCLQGLDKIPEDKYKTYEWNQGMVYSSSVTKNVLIWKSAGELKEEYDKLIRVFRIIMSGESKLANLLREYQEVVIGDLQVKEVLFRKS